jgi:sugar lactone lactonase YvrE
MIKERLRVIKLVSLLVAMLVSMTGCSNASTEVAQSSPSVSSPPISAVEIISQSKNTPERQSNMENGITSTSDYAGINDETVTLTLLHTYAGFSSPTGITVDDDGNIYVTNWSGRNITKIDTNGNYSIVCDKVGSPSGIAMDNEGNLYNCDYSGNVVYKVTPDSNSTVFASGFSTPAGLFYHPEGYFLVCNRVTNQILKMDMEGNYEPVASGLRTPVAVALDPLENLFVMNFSGGVIKVTPDGNQEFTDDFGQPSVGMGFDSKYHLFGTDIKDGCVRQITSDGKAKIVIDGIDSAVALFVKGDTLYVSGWGSNSVYVYSIETK